MDIPTIITQLTESNLLPPANWQYTALTGGTMSQAFLLRQENGSAYVLKFNKAMVTESEAEFLLAYQRVLLLPDLVAVDPSYCFMAYTYIPGSTVDPLNNSKKELLQTLVHGLINQYQPVSGKRGWGWQDATVSSWEQFLTEEVLAAKEILMPCLKKEGLQITAPLPVAQNQNAQQKPYFIHGDCGIHNLIVREEKLVGVIDPMPILGYPHYDLIYAFFSSPADTTKETLDSAFGMLSMELPGNKQLYEEVLIGLYLRLAICVKHHPADFPAYLKAWSYWSRIVNSQ
ncbi:aminoglycoside phosphotransferase family protein [Planococcus sp. ISL-110]|uniref:aminoglycoside phosphotransferase family protein n=1 Tax=Planococcus sp. ISL-110 TaxID=2819167 RepID=UPI001BEBBCEF|nr:aminoglycoside phosphotransferase family protein [Planococcus sp. ISL-110]MBT2572206.1 aminoglycoside phosphotransferase family protein [Planococcus sp. ISL-110]